MGWDYWTWKAQPVSWVEECYSRLMVEAEELGVVR